MHRNRKAVSISAVILSLAFIAWQLPALLKMVPSRYVAAYLPQFLQPLAERDHVDVLPAAVVSADATFLLDDVEPSLSANPQVDSHAELPPAVAIIQSSEPLDSQPPDSQPPVSEPPDSEPPVPIATVSSAELDEAGSAPEPESAATTSRDVEGESGAVWKPVAEPDLGPIPSTARLTNLRHEFQGWNNCGPATLAMALSYFGLGTNQVQTASVLKPNPEDRNVSPHEMTSYVNDITEFGAIDRVNGTMDKLKRFIAKGFPVIVELGLDPPGEYRWMGWYGHYLLLIAYDDTLSKFWVYDSWFGTGEVPGDNTSSQGRSLIYEDLATYWPQFNRNYIVLFREEQRTEVEEIIGPDMDDEGMWHRALDRVKEETAASRQDPYRWFNLGTIYAALGEFELAAAAFDQARAIGLPWRMLWYQFGPYEAYYQIGRYDDVILLADVTLKDRPYFEESFFYRGLARAALGQLEEAEKDLEQAVQFNPNFGPASQALAELFG